MTNREKTDYGKNGQYLQNTSIKGILKNFLYIASIKQKKVIFKKE